MNFLYRFVRSLRFWGGVLSDHDGVQTGFPVASDKPPVSPDTALQLAAVYACVDLLSNTIASFPIMVYRRKNGGTRMPAEDSRLWMILHDSPNGLMTPMDVWRALVVQLVLRGNAYALIERNGKGEVTQLWPLASDQMTDFVEDGQQFYAYGRDGQERVFRADDILHLKGIGTGLHGFGKLDFMSSTVTEADSLASFAENLAGTANKPSGIVKVSHITSAEQRRDLMNRLMSFKQGDARFLLIDGDMEFKQVSLTPQESQLLETRQFTTDEICRWFGVPPQLIGAGTTASWGNGIEQITAGFEKYTLAPMVTSIEQAIRKRLMTPQERREFDVEFSMYNLTKASLKDRSGIYSTMVQNGIWTRNQCRAFEGMEPVEGGDDLTAQTSLAPLSKLGQVANNGSPAETTLPVKQ